jgi:hypothetical protein
MTTAETIRAAAEGMAAMHAADVASMGATATPEDAAEFPREALVSTLADYGIEATDENDAALRDAIAKALAN